MANAVDRARNLDLNLLLALDAVLRTRSVSRAAAELQIGQPAVSKSLARLRRYFDDELLVRRGRGFELTGLARRLAPQVQDLLTSVDRVLGVGESPDLDAPFEVTIAASDALAALFTPVISRRLREAPKASLRVVSPVAGGAPSVDAVVEVLASGSIDGLIVPHGWLTGLEHQDLLEDAWVFVVAAHDRRTRLDLDDLAARPWVNARLPNGSLHLGMQRVLEAGVQPRVEVDVDSSMAVPMFLPGTDRVAVIARSVVDRFGGELGIKEVEGPVSLGRFRHAFWWHPSRTDDARHRWLRSVVDAAARELDRHAGGS